MKKTAKRRIKKNLVNFLRQTRFFCEFSFFFYKYRDKVIKIQLFYRFFIQNRMVVLLKLWQHECKNILFEDQRLKKLVPKDMAFYIKKLNEGFSEVTLSDCILNIKP